MVSSDTPQNRSPIDKDQSIETIGVDDGPFELHRKDPSSHKNNAPLLAVLTNGPSILSVRAGSVQVDGTDGTQKTLELLRQLPRRPVILSGVTVGGFNLIHPKTLQEGLKIPIIVVVGSRPNKQSIKKALLRHFPDWKQRWNIINGLGPIRTVRTVDGEPKIYFEPFGCTILQARALLKKTALVSRIPEPLRIAGIIAKGVFPRMALMETRRHSS